MNKSFDILLYEKTGYVINSVLAIVTESNQKDPVLIRHYLMKDSYPAMVELDQIADQFSPNGLII